MINVVLTGVIAEYNFGSPSILHGMDELLKIVFEENYRIVNFQKTKVVSACNSDFCFPIYQSKKTVKKLLISLLIEKTLGRIIGERDSMIKAIKQADIVIDLFGICFCDNFNKEKYYPHKAITHAVGKFAPLFVAKSFGVKTVKNTCSFGPMKCQINNKAAAFASQWLFDVILAREQQSRDALTMDAKVKKTIITSPDIANLMKYQVNRINRAPKIGISTSHQIIKQWSAKESYIDCIVELCLHINKKYRIPVVLIPNEFNPNQSYNDIDVSNEIQEILKKKEVAVEVLDVLNMTSSEIKNTIAECDVLIASRYHSCVAALSSGVPTLVVGWHYKYDELLAWYNQKEWLVSNNDCSSEKIINTFDYFWIQKEESRRIIQDQYPKVRQAVIEAGRAIFSK